MIEDGRIIGLGSAYIDAKIQSSQLHLPSERDRLPAFLDIHPEADLYAGGSIPNILTAFIRLSVNMNARLFCCVGNDSRGKFYAAHTDSRLGEPAVSTRNSTGVWVGIYNNNILVEESDFYGAAGDVTVSSRELRTSRNEVFVTDIDACRTPEALDSAKRILDVTEESDLFVLSLSGADSQENIQQLLSFTNKVPNVVFGNVSELSYITNEIDIVQSIQTAFPTSSLVVITQGGKGAVIRFKEQVVSIPAKYIPPDRLVDSTGAGDSYMGAMLALLLRDRDREWSIGDVISAAKAASFASSLVIQSVQPRLTADMAQLVLDFYK